MGFLAAAAPIAGAIGSLFGGAGKNTNQVAPATGNAQFTEQNLQPAINTAQGDYSSQLQKANQVFGGQNALAQQLNAQTQGQGPNIAQLQLQQATNRNIQQGAGLIGSQRGMNPALAARLIAQQTAGANQQAAGQSGLMRAEQQLAAQNALANVYGQQANNALSGGQLANQNLGINQTALGQQNDQIVRARGAANEQNARTAQANAGVSGNLIGGLTGGLSSALAGPLGGMLSGGGGSKNLADSALSAGDLLSRQQARGFSEGGDTIKQGAETISKSISKSTAEIMKEAFEKRARGGKVNDYRQGGHVPGKAKHPGDDSRNDVVPAMLSKGEVVLPNSITKSPDAPDRAKEFMKAIKEQRDPGPKGFSKILEAKRMMQEAMKHMEEVHKMMKKS